MVNLCNSYLLWDLYSYKLMLKIKIINVFIFSIINYLDIFNSISLHNEQNCLICFNQFFLYRYYYNGHAITFTA